jgi:hypothetical protein
VRGCRLVSTARVHPLVHPASNVDNPSEFLQEGSNRTEVASAKDSLGRFKRSSQSQRLKGVAEGYPDVVENARIPVAVDHTLGATVPYSLGAIKLID